MATDAGLGKLRRLAAIQRPVNDALFASVTREDFEKLTVIMDGLSRGADKAIRLAEHLTTADGP